MASVDEVTRSLADWVAGIVPEVPVVILAAATDATLHEGILVRLHRLVPLPASCVAGAPPGLSLHYFVEVRLQDPLAAHRALGDIAFAALSHPDWRAEAAEYPTLALAATLTRPHEVQRAPLVRQPLRLRSVPVGPLEGVLVGPGGVPLAGARVRLAETGQSAATDAEGRFRLAAALASEAELRLQIEARGRRFAVTARAEAPLTITLPLEE